MLNLIKYDWMKRWKLFLAGLMVFIFLNLDLLYRTISQSDPNAITAIFVLVLFVMSVALFFDHVGRIYRSLFKEEGQLLFSLPINGYRFLGGKMLAVIMESLALMLLVGVTLYLDFKIIKFFLPGFLPQLTLTSNITLTHFGQGIEILGLILLSYLGFLLMVNLSMVLVKSIFSSNKHGILLSFIFFLILTKIFSFFSSAFTLITNYPFNGSSTGMGESWLITGIFVLLIFAATGYLLDRKINL